MVLGAIEIEQIAIASNKVSERIANLGEGLSRFSSRGAGYQTQSLSPMERNYCFYCLTAIPRHYFPLVVNFYSISNAREVAGCSLENCGCSHDSNHLTVAQHIHVDVKKNLD